MAQRYEQNRQQILEGKLEKLFGEYAIMSFVIDLAQILSAEKVSVRIYADTIMLTYDDGDSFYMENDELLLLSGLDTETIEFVKESINDLTTDAA